MPGGMSLVRYEHCSLSSNMPSKVGQQTDRSFIWSIENLNLRSTEILVICLVELPVYPTGLSDQTRQSSSIETS